MEWFSLPSAWPASVDVVAGWGIVPVVLLVACVPGWLAARHALRRALAAPRSLRLRVVHGGAETKRHAA
jgi:hypothetical protein